MVAIHSTVFCDPRSLSRHMSRKWCFYKLNQLLQSPSNDQNDGSPHKNDESEVARDENKSSNSTVNLRLSIPLASALARNNSDNHRHGEDTVPSTPSWHSSRKTSLESMQYDA